MLNFLKLIVRKRLFSFFPAGSEAHLQWTGNSFCQAVMQVTWSTQWIELTDNWISCKTESYRPECYSCPYFCTCVWLAESTNIQLISKCMFICCTVITIEHAVIELCLNLSLNILSVLFMHQSILMDFWLFVLRLALSGNLMLTLHGPIIYHFLQFSGINIFISCSCINCFRLVAVFTLTLTQPWNIH